MHLEEHTHMHLTIDASPGYMKEWSQHGHSHFVHSFALIVVSFLFESYLSHNEHPGNRRVVYKGQSQPYIGAACSSFSGGVFAFQAS